MKKQKCKWCLKHSIRNPEWEQKGLDGKWKPLCSYCTRRRLNNPYNALLDMRKTTPPTPKQDKPQEECPQCGLQGKQRDKYCGCIVSQPPQKEGCKNDTYTYEETLETVKKLSKLMQKEGWEEEFDKKFVAQQGKKKVWWVDNPKRIKDYVHSLLATERQKVEEMMNEVIGEKESEKVFYINRKCNQCLKPEGAIHDANCYVAECIIRNKLRSEQRAKLQRIMGKK